MKIIIVDKKDRPIGIKDRNDVDYEKDIYRVSALWITNSRGEILLARRAFTKKQNPGRWGPAVAGTLEDGETYDGNIIKETEEELGLKNINPERAAKKLISGKYRFFVQWFHLKTDKIAADFKYDKKEVAEIRWFTKKEIINIVNKKPNDIIEEEMKMWIEMF